MMGVVHNDLFQTLIDVNYEVENAATGFGAGGNESEELVILDPNHVSTVML